MNSITDSRPESTLVIFLWDSIRYKVIRINYW